MVKFIRTLIGVCSRSLCTLHFIKHCSLVLPWVVGLGTNKQNHISELVPGIKLKKKRFLISSQKTTDQKHNATWTASRHVERFELESFDFRCSALTCSPDKGQVWQRARATSSLTCRPCFTFHTAPPLCTAIVSQRSPCLSLSLSDVSHYFVNQLPPSLCNCTRAGAQATRSLRPLALGSPASLLSRRHWCLSVCCVPFCCVISIW